MTSLSTSFCYASTFFEIRYQVLSSLGIPGQIDIAQFIYEKAYLAISSRVRRPWASPISIDLVLDVVPLSIVEA